MDRKKTESKKPLLKSEEVGGFHRSEIIHQAELARLEQEAAAQQVIRLARLRARTNADRLFREFCVTLSGASIAEDIDILSHKLEMIQAEITKVQQYSLSGYTITEPAEAIQPFYIQQLTDLATKKNKKLMVLIAERDKYLIHAKEILHSKFFAMPPKIRLLAFIEELKIIDSIGIPLLVKPSYKILLDRSIVELKHAITIATVGFAMFKQKNLDGHPVFARTEALHKKHLAYKLFS